MQRYWCLFLVSCLPPIASGQDKADSLIFSGNYQNGQFESLTFVNPVMGWDLFFNNGFLGQSTAIGNIEAGHVWFGHEVFLRPPNSPGFVTYQNPSSLNEIDYHATTVGHVLAGSGYVPGSNGSYTYAGLGMAPAATLVSGAIATGFSSTDVGSFSLSHESMVTAYRDFFKGTNLGGGVSKLDVINSSWGGTGPSAMDPGTLAIDGLARQNSTVALVISAGNGGPAPVSAPASGYNGIAVGSLGGAEFLTPSGFSSRGKNDFYNPVTGITHYGVRVAVDLAAPGERLFLAGYFGDSGSIGASDDLDFLVDPSLPDDLYFVNMDGTSYAAPFVAGGIALLKDAANAIMPGKTYAQDTRVIKSVLMAGSQTTEGWNNHQNSFHVTTQALDANSGAGALDLAGSADVYFGQTRDLVDLFQGGVIGSSGWDAAVIGLGQRMDYRFASAFTQYTALTVALNWFSVREFDDESGIGSDLAFSNLDLQIWRVDDDGVFTTKVGESRSIYNNTEFLRFGGLESGRYGFRVVFDSMVYDTTGLVSQEFYGLAWNTEGVEALAIPEPSFAVIFSTTFFLLVMGRSRK
jgi:hypothetical protein